MLELIKQPWPWYAGGLFVGLTVPALLLIGNKSFGISSSLRHICAACIPGNISFFQYNWKKEAWNLFFVAGIFIGGYLAVAYLQNDTPIQLSESTAAYLESKNVNDFNALLPVSLFSWESLFSLKGFILIVVGGFLVGFGTRYAGGCTSGHAIMGLSNLQLPSLIATVCFMVGGFIMTWLILPHILNL